MINCNVPHISTFSFLFTRKAVPLRSNYPVKLLKYYVTDSEIETNRTQIQTRNTSNWPFVHFIECWFYCCCWYLSLSNSKLYSNISELNQMAWLNLNVKILKVINRRNQHFWKKKINTLTHEIEHHFSFYWCGSLVFKWRFLKLFCKKIENESFHPVQIKKCPIYFLVQ